MFSVAAKHMSSTGKILASRVMGASGGTIKPVKKHYDIAMSYAIHEENGSAATTVQTLFPSGKYSALDYTPTWAHHRFGGWFESAATPTTAVPTGTTISPSDSVVYDRSDVYARWQLPATVNFDATSGGGQMPGGWTAPDYYIGQPYGTLPVPTKSGQVFLGWFTAGGTRITEGTVVESSGATLTARYMAVSYTTTYTCTTTSSYKNTGIYSATRYSSSYPIVVDWGDGSIDVVYGGISQLAHTYSSVATFTVKISDNISSLQMSSSDSTWYTTTSQNRYTLKTIASLDSKITNYPSYCFYYCSALTSVVVPSGMTMVNTYCFYYCSALQNVALPSSCTSIGNNAFQYSGLRTTAGFALPSSLTSIGSGAFRNITNSYFTTLTIPGTVTTIGSYAFYYCYYLKNITFASGSGTLTLNSYAFAYCGYYSAMALDMSTRTVTTIPSQCFYYCRYLKEFVFPKGVTTIGTYAFYYCWNQSSAAGTLTIPEGVTSISSSYAFAYCYYLTEISLPSTLSSIGTYAFYYCSRLATIHANRLTAPTVQSTTFGNSTTYYTGRNSYSAGTNRLYVPTGATGYSSSYWADPLCSSSKCGFTLEAQAQTPYIMPDGGAYWDSGFYGGDNCEYIFDCMWLQFPRNVSGGVQIANEYTLMGSNLYSGIVPCTFNYSATSADTLTIQANQTEVRQSASSSFLNVRSTLRAKMRVGDNYLRIGFDGGTMGSVSKSTSITTGSVLYICSHAADGQWDTGVYEPMPNNTVAIFGIEIRQNGAVVKKYTPAMHNGSPCFHEEVGDTYIYSMGNSTGIYGTYDGTSLTPVVT